MDADADANVALVPKVPGDQAILEMTALVDNLLYRC